MLQIKIPPKHLQVVVKCVNDENPPENVQDWIKRGKTYTLKGTTEAMNVSGMSFIIADENGKELRPTKSMCGFKGSRFEFLFELYKN